MTPVTNAFTQQGKHETQIRGFFPGAFVNESAEPRFPRKPLYILAFTNRSGSNLLADYLRQTGKFRGFGEGLNWDEVQRHQQADPVASFPDFVARMAGAPNEPGNWGIKASWDQIAMLYRARIPAMFAGVRIIHSIRQDLLGQSVSHWIAHQTNRWTSAHKDSAVTPEFSQSRIEQIMMDVARSNTYVDQLVQTLGIQRNIVIYERLLADPAAEMRSLAEAFSVDLGDWKPGTPRISQQRDDTNERFRQSCLDAWRAAVSP